MRLTLFLGAGFSHAAGCPLARELFDAPPFHTGLQQLRTINRVRSAWRSWRAENPEGVADDFIRESQKPRVPWKYAVDWKDIVQFLGYALADRFVDWIEVAGVLRPRNHDIYGAKIGATLDSFWGRLFELLNPREVGCILTTNYDVVIERGLRPRPTPRRNRPGFNYGAPGEIITGCRGYPISGYKTPYELTGWVPVLKLHGSLNWALEQSTLVKYGDCRPALKGEAAVLPPGEMSELPPWLLPIWSAAASRLTECESLLVVGYSLPQYDRDVKELLVQNLSEGCAVHIFDPNSREVGERYRRSLPGREIFTHPGLPDCTRILPQVLRSRA